MEEEVVHLISLYRFRGFPHLIGGHILPNSFILYMTYTINYGYVVLPELKWDLTQWDMGAVSTILLGIILLNMADAIKHFKESRKESIESFKESHIPFSSIVRIKSTECKKGLYHINKTIDRVDVMVFKPEEYALEI